MSGRGPVNNIFLWFIVLLHLHVLLFKNATAKASKVSSCPFQVASHFFCRQTSFFTNSFLFRSPAALKKIRSASPDGFQRMFRTTNVALMVRPDLADLEPAESCPPSPKMIPTSEFFKSNLEELMPTTPTSHLPRRSASKAKGGGDKSSLEVMVIGLSHHNTKVDVREKLAIPEHLWNEASTALCEYDSISEASVLSTCNRFEIYLSGPNQYDAIRDAVDFLVRRSGGQFDAATLKKNLFMLSGEDAVWHLMRVSAGLDSLVLGEGQILAQVRRCYEHGVAKDSLAVPALPGVGGESTSKQSKLIGGRAGKVVGRLLNSAIAAGKKVRTETSISKGAVSVSSAAAEFSNSRIARDCGLSHLKEAEICIVGAGKMTKLLMHHLASGKIKKVTIVNRSLASIEALQAAFPSLNIVPRTMDKLYETIAASDVVFTSTASALPIVEEKPLRSALTAANRTKGLQMIDISVPRNIHEDCDGSSNVACYSVDDLKAVVQKNSNKRKKEVVEAETLLAGEVAKFMQFKAALGAVPTICDMIDKFEDVRQECLDFTRKRWTHMSPEEYKAVDGLSYGMMKKLLRGPLEHLKTQAGEGAAAAVQHMRSAFQL